MAASGKIVEWVEVLRGWSAYAGRRENLSGIGADREFRPTRTCLQSLGVPTFASFIANL